MNLNFLSAELVLTAGNPGQFPQSGKPQIALSGRSNVGKSSLLNCLIGRKNLARVSSSPGKTITLNFYDVDKKLFLVDLPGYGYAKRSEESRRVWASATESYFTKYLPSIPFLSVLQLVDLRAGLTQDDDMMLDFLENASIPYFLVATKCDKLNKTDRAKSEAELKSRFDENVKIFSFSALTGEGRDAIRSHVLGLVNEKR